MEVKKYKNTWVRKNKRVDREMVRDCHDHYRYYKFDSESVVLDLGGNIGGFATIVLASDAKSYTVYEPDADNFEVLKLNTNDPRATAIQSAVSMSKEENLYFYSSTSNNSACSGSVNPSRNKKIKVEVKNEYFGDVLDRVRPTHLKMDIEGAEFDWLMDNQGVFPSYIKEFSIELHGEKTFYNFDQVWYNSIIKDFDIIDVSPEIGFVKEDSKLNYYPNLGINEKGRLFGIDVFMRRK